MSHIQYTSIPRQLRFSQDFKIQLNVKQNKFIEGARLSCVFSLYIYMVPYEVFVTYNHLQNSGTTPDFQFFRPFLPSP